MDFNIPILTACFSTAGEANNERYENIEQSKRIGERLANQKTQQDAIEPVPGTKTEGLTSTPENHSLTVDKSCCPDLRAKCHSVTACDVVRYISMTVITAPALIGPALLKGVADLDVDVPGTTSGLLSVALIIDLLIALKVDKRLIQYFTQRAANNESKVEDQATLQQPSIPEEIPLLERSKREIARVQQSNEELPILLHNTQSCTPASIDDSSQASNTHETQPMKSVRFEASLTDNFFTDTNDSDDKSTDNKTAPLALSESLNDLIVSSEGDGEPPEDEEAGFKTTTA
ncbi:hypothetical protein [Endozoicomonas atrinae]|uniref:hypothetical protein n=1 Tax=Endozoicomonas atrinae TaxID=1333660 RepID=UPI003B00C78A